MKRPVKSPPQPIHTPRYPKGLCLHTLVEFNHCDPERLKKVAFVRKSLIQSVKAGGGTIVKTLFHEFSPWGVSGVVVITESHVTVHTWPEHGYAAVDIFSCSPKLNHLVIRNQLALSFGARQSRAKRLHRGPKSGHTPKTKTPRPSK